VGSRSGFLSAPSSGSPQCWPLLGGDSPPESTRVILVCASASKQKRTQTQGCLTADPLTLGYALGTRPSCGCALEMDARIRDRAPRIGIDIDG
jgi:hypothetical protein